MRRRRGHRHGSASPSARGSRARCASGPGGSSPNPSPIEPGNRPEESERDRLERSKRPDPPEARLRVLGPATPVDGQARRSLVPANRNSSCSGRSPPSKPPGSNPPGVKEVLERRDVPPPALPRAHRARARDRACRAGRGRRASAAPAIPVRPEPVLGLEGANRLLRPRPGDPVDGVWIQADGAHRHLEGSDICASRRWPPRAPRAGSRRSPPPARRTLCLPLARLFRLHASLRKNRARPCKPGNRG